VSIIKVEGISKKYQLGHIVSQKVQTQELTPDPTRIINDNFLSEMVVKMRQVGSPEKIVLFGSRARGDASSDSDIDLLVIEKSDLPRYKRAARYRRAVAGMCAAKDIVVWSPEEIDEWKTVPNAFITTILREGQVLYEA